jgi:putative membrane protein
LPIEHTYRPPQARRLVSTSKGPPMNTRTPSLLASAVLALAATVGAQAQAATGLSHQDSSFLKDAAAANNAEVQASRIALAQSANGEVKSFAQSMIDEHTSAQDELKALADRKGVKVSDTPSLTKQAEIKLLAKRKDASFDQHYAEAIGVKAHEDTIKLFRKEAEKGDDPDVKAWAAKTLPALAHHLELAQDLKTKTDAEPKR